jgi:hypothetical protein
MQIPNMTPDPKEIIRLGRAGVSMRAFCANVNQAVRKTNKLLCDFYTNHPSYIAIKNLMDQKIQLEQKQRKRLRKGRRW